MSRLVFTPLEASNAAEIHVDELQKNNGDGMPLYLPSMEYNPAEKKGFLPVKRGELITVTGRPGNGKTGFMFRWARQRANDLQKRAKAGDELAANSVVLYWTMEQMIEELRLFHVAAEDNISITDMANGKLTGDDWSGIKKTLRSLQGNPLWMGGKSFSRRKDKARLDEAALKGALESIEVWQGDNLKTQVDSVFIDYLQRFRPGSGDWVQFYGDLVNACKDMAGDFATRFILGVQAKREVDSRRVPVPMMDDGQWTSSIEHQADGMISVVRPSHYLPPGSIWDEDKANILVQGHRQMMVFVTKRKLGPENFASWVNFEPEYNRMDELELKSVFNDNDEAPRRSQNV